MPHWEGKIDAADVGANIRRARVAAGHENATEFAISLGWSPTVLYRWETGRTLPTATHLERLSTVLGVPVDWLLRGPPPINPALASFLATDYGRRLPTHVREQLAQLPVPEGGEANEDFYRMVATIYMSPAGVTLDEAAKGAAHTQWLLRDADGALDPDEEPEEP